LASEGPYIEESTRWARFGVDQDGIKYIPIGGVCVMVYLISKKDGKLLVGKIDGVNHSEYWRNEWAIYIHRPSIWKEKWFVPSGFLHFGENPDDCAQRLLTNLLGATANSVKPIKWISFTQNSKYYTGYKHWHICFIYQIDELKLSKKPEYFSALEYIDIKQLSASNVGMAGARVLQDLGLVR